MDQRVVEALVEIITRNLDELSQIEKFFEVRGLEVPPDAAKSIRIKRRELNKQLVRIRSANE